MTDQEIIAKVEGAIAEAIKSDLELLGTGGVEDTFAATLRDKLLFRFSKQRKPPLT